MVLEPQSRTTSSPRPSRWRSAPRTSCRASTSATIRCWPGASTPTSTRRSRGWADPNFHEIPINSPIAPVHNNQRDGMHRQAIHRGRVAYEPNSLAGGCPFQAGAQGFVSFPRAGAARTRCAASRRSSPTTTRRRGSSSTARPRSEKAHIDRRLPLRAEQGDGAGDPRAHAVVARQRVERAGAARWPRAWAWTVPRADAACARNRRSQPEVERRPRCR